jgi:DNA-binding transcriptional regulator YdaS (Cro superfamily)
MCLSKFIENPIRLDALAKALNTNPQYLRQIATRFRGRTCSPKFALRIEQATDGAVRKETLRPDIWPELVQKSRHKKAA